MASVHRVSSDPTPGRLFAGSQNTAVLRLPLLPALPIPLGIAAPAGVTLATWAFSGLEEGAAGGPVCLLALEGTLDGILGRDLTLATHFRDIPIRCEPASEALSEAERTLLARALLSAGPSGLAALAGLLSLIEPALAALAPTDDAPALTQTGPGATLTGTAIPHALLIHTAAGWGCARVATGRLHFAGDACVRLTLEPLWGAAPDGARAAVALQAHGFVPLRVRTA
ncbi:hypothetical protein ASG52_14655 [Methylobacterium sp. Leaf456]|uniref:hypothetical protein n=1 Tax=Methylobacterium sp. Leaf456 TaxID=1736382 RepID=UPI000701CE18|nr:hypothetical protein [Methylobacterium sp. Leaf456]KQT45404.1 hypothetical protein ASG52_14655 [Methylobacterium sp. Leaf456]